MITASILWLWAFLAPWLWWLIGGILWACGGVLMAWSHALQCCGVVWVFERFCKWWQENGGA